jgi:MFS family permease
MSNQKLYYGWVIVFVSFLIFFVVIGVSISPSSLFIVPVTEHFGFSRGDFSIALTLSTIINVLIQLFFGPLHKWLGIRKLIIIGVLMAPVAFLVAYFSNTLVGFYISGLLTGICLALASITSISLLLNNWFTSRQGLLLGLIVSGSGFGGSLFSVIIGNQIAQNGFRSAYLLSAILVALATMPVILLIRSHPKKDRAGSENQPVDRPQSLGDSSLSTVKMSFRDFLAASSNRIGMLAVFFIGCAIHPVLASAPAYLVEKGFDAFFGAAITSAAYFVLAIAKIVIGLIHDRVGVKISLSFTLSALIISAFLIILAKEQWLVWVFSIFTGVAISTNAVLVPLYAKTLLGDQNYSHFLGIFIATLAAGIGISTPLVNYIYDIMGSYTWGFVLIALSGGTALLLVFRSLRTKKNSALVREGTTIL